MRHAHVIGCALLVAGVGCRTSFPAPTTTPRAPLRAAPEVSAPRGDVDAIHALERGCRARLEHNTTEASMTALDRVREVLGSSCDVTTVDRDPLHWTLHCRSDALFASGQYDLADETLTPCRELGDARVSAWQCVGAVLKSLSTHAAIEHMGAAIVGHVDMQRMNAGSTSHMCQDLMESLHYVPKVAWSTVSATADDTERQRANEQLAFCRAASVGSALHRGISDETTGRATFDLAVVGAGASWLRSRADGTCPAHGERWQTRGDCLDARRVDLLVRFTPKVERTQSTCNADRTDPSGALYCWEQCVEQAAAGQRAGSGIATTSVPLFVRAGADTSTPPPGFYIHALTSSRDSALDLRVVCKTLGVAPPLCTAVAGVDPP